jgi:uncharacterized protein YcbK (DUF882 family)
MTSSCIEYSSSLDGQCLVDQTTANRALVGALPKVKDDGSFTFDQIDAWGDEFVTTYLVDAENNPVAKAELQYGAELYIQLNNINSYARNIDLGPWPDLSDRLQRGELGIIEYVDFLNEFNYTISDLQTQTQINPATVAFQLDSYYKNTFYNSVMGGFCKRIEGVFGAIDAFFDLVNAVNGFITKALSFVGNLKSGKFFKDIAEQGLAKVLIKEIEEKIISVIQKAWKKIQQTLENFNLLNYVDCAANFINQNVAKRAYKLRQEALAFLNDVNLKSLIKRVEKLFDYAVNLFDRPGLAEIQYLVLRFCSFISNIEALINEIKKPSQNFALKYQTVVNRLDRASSAASALAVASGAKRYSKEQRKISANALAAKWTNPDGEILPTNTGNKPANMPEITCKEINNIPTWDEVRLGKSSIFTFQNDGKSFIDKEAAWTGMHCNFLVNIMRIQKEIGKPFQINSGWRSQQANKQVGGADNSYHGVGRAIDISKKTLNSDDIKKIRSLVKKYNYEVLSYGSHIHIEPAPSGS